MYAKVFAQIFDSSIADDWQVRHVFEDMLKLADPAGNVDMTVGALASRTRMPEDIVRRAVQKLSEPDPESRNPENEGRRIEKMDDHRSWGWHIINYEYYNSLPNERTKRERQADRAKRYRDKKRDASRSVTPVTLPASRSVTPVTPPAHIDVKANTDAEADGVTHQRDGGAGGSAPASKGQSSGDAEGASVGTEHACLPSSFSSKSKNEAEASPAPPPSSPASPNRTLVLGGSPAPRQQKAHIAPTSPAQRPAPPVEPWDALDYVMAHWDDPGEFQGYPWKVVCRAVFFAWKLTDKPYWPTRGIDSVDALKRAIATMVAQTPEGTKVPGSATLIIARRDPDPACPQCGGSGSVPNTGYVGDNSIGGGRLAEAYRQFCWCTDDESGADRRPWKNWRRDAE